MNGQKYTHHPFHIRLWKRTTFIYKTLARLGEGKEKIVRAICEVTIIQLSNIPQNTNHGAWREWLGRRGGSGHEYFAVFIFIYGLLRPASGYIRMAELSFRDKSFYNALPSQQHWHATAARPVQPLDTKLFQKSFSAFQGYGRGYILSAGYGGCGVYWGVRRACGSFQHGHVCHLLNSAPLRCASSASGQPGLLTSSFTCCHHELLILGRHEFLRIYEESVTIKGHCSGSACAEVPQCSA